MEISSKQFIIVVGFGIAAIIEFVCGLLVYRRNPKDPGNRFTSLGYFSIALGMISYLIYVIYSEETIILLLHRCVIISEVIAATFLFLGSLYISEGIKSLKSYRISLVILNLCICILLLFIPGMTIHLNPGTTPVTVEFIEWEIYFFILGSFPVYLTIILTSYYYLKIWRDIPRNSEMKLAFLHIIAGTVLLGIAHFLTVVPHILWDYTSDTLLLTSSINIGSFFGALASIMIYLGYRRRISESIST